MTYEFDTIQEAVRHLADNSTNTGDQHILFLLRKIVMSMHMRAHGEKDDHAMFVGCHSEIRELSDFLRSRG